MSARYGSMFPYVREVLDETFGGESRKQGIICRIYKKVNILNDSGFH